MAILANPDYFEMEEQGHTGHVLVAVRYVGNNRRYGGQGTVNQGRWPANNDFLRGVWYVAFVPETTPDSDPGVGVAWFERNSAFDVTYDPEDIARVLLNRNYLSLEAGGPIGDADTLPGFDEKLHDALGIEPEHEAGKTVAHQLQDLAGLDAEPASEAPVATEKDLVETYDRVELKEAVKEIREDAGEFSLRGKAMADMAAYLADELDDPASVVEEVNR